MKASLLFLLALPFSPTEQHLKTHSVEDIKYSLRLHNTTFEYKPLFDKAMALEKEGFIGYYADAGSFRVYQDLIRIVFEEVLGIAIPEDFHFLAVPLYPERTIKTLDDIASAYLTLNPKPHRALPSLLPMQLALYANYKQTAFCPVRAFGKRGEKSFQDLYWLFDQLKMDPHAIDEAFELAKETFGAEDHLLLQFFDTSENNWIDAHIYPATPTGFPYENAALSDYLHDETKALPPQFYMILSDSALLNPKSPFRMKRYTKVQASKLKALEMTLRELIKKQTFNITRRDEYENNLAISFLPL